MTAEPIPITQGNEGEGDHAVAYPGVTFGHRRLDIEPGMPFATWQRLGEFLTSVAEDSLFWLGEWAIYGEREYGEAYAQAISAESGYAVESVKVAQWVAERVPADRRKAELSWAHHRAVAALEPGEQEKWLDTAASENLTSRELYDQSRGRVSGLVDPSDPDPEPEPVVDRCPHMAMTRAWHEAFGVAIRRDPVAWVPERELRAQLVREEAAELVEAIESGDLEAIALELADMLQVTYGAVLTFGIPIDAVFAEVHRSHMTKRGPDGEVELREDGKILKGPHYEPPDLAPILDPSCR